ncbi:hypothetical protein GBAR_LOCUS28936, partial [Geodia barretti]
TSFYRTPRSLSSLSVLSSSIASLAITGDLLEHFGLSSSYPSELHISCLYGLHMPRPAPLINALAHCHANCLMDHDRRAES